MAPAPKKGNPTPAIAGVHADGHPITAGELAPIRPMQNPVELNFHNCVEREKDVFYFANIDSAGRNGPSAFGGLLTAICLVAADKTVDAALKAHCVNVTYIAPALIIEEQGEGVTCTVQRIFDGRSFATRLVIQRQAQKTTVVAQISYHAVEPDAIIHATSMPAVRPPEQCGQHNVYRMNHPSVKRLLKDGKFEEGFFKKEIYHQFPYETRTVNIREMFGQEQTTQHEAPKVYTWMKFLYPIDPAYEQTHRQLFTYMSDQGHLCAAMRPHFKNDFDSHMFYSLNHSVYIHRPQLNMNEWFLCETQSTHAKSGRMFNRASYWSRDGVMIGSVSTEGIARTKGPASQL